MLTASITTSQNSQCDRFTINDTTSYADEPTSGFNSRKITIYKSDGTVFRQPGQTVDQIEWPFANGNSLLVIGLQQDFAFNVVMVLDPQSPQGGSNYIASQKIALSCYLNTELYERGKRQSEDPRYERNVIWTNDSCRLLLERDGASAAIADDDIESAQLCLSRAKKIIDNNRKPY